MNLGRDKNPLLIGNINLGEIKNNKELQRCLNSWGVLNFDKITKNANDETGIVKGFVRSKEQRLALLEFGSKMFRTTTLDYELTFKPLINQPKRCRYCNVLALKHPKSECNESSSRCGKCADHGHAARDCTKHWSKFYCVNCEVRGHSAYDRRRCPILVELEEAGCLAELKRQRKELGKPCSLTTDPNAKSYKEAVENNLSQDISEIKSELKKSRAERKEENKGLVNSIKKLFENNNKIVAKQTHNQICDNIKKFRSEFNREVDHKIDIVKYEIIKMLQDSGTISNFDNPKPSFIDFNAKFDEIFKNEDDSMDEDEDDEEEEAFSESADESNSAEPGRQES